MTSTREGRPRKSILYELLATHQARYDSVDNIHWGCICHDGVECRIIVLVGALNDQKRETVRVSNDLKREYELHRAEIRKLTATIAGLETYNRVLKGENDELRSRLDS